jgi:nitrite reductase (NO-forming)
MIKEESLDDYYSLLYYLAMSKDTWIVLAVIVAFIGSGFAYKYTLSPYATEGRSATSEVGTSGMGMMAIPSVAEIGADAFAVPPPIVRKENATVKYTLEAIAVQSEIAPGVTYEYWTFNKQVPAPMMRVKEGDTVEVSLSHNPAGHSHASVMEGLDFAVSGPFGVETAHADTGHSHDASAVVADPHTAGATMPMGHSAHSIDLHAVLGPGGGAMLTQTGHDETKTFAFKAMRPGIYIYHCASPHIPTHIANGMYGMILVEPKEGMAKVDKEFYVMQGEFYTAGKNGEKGLQAFSKEKMDMEHPEYVVFNGRVGSLTEGRALKAKVGETVRVYFGVGTFLPSNFHIIGGIMDKLYPEGDIVSPPHRNVQTTLVPAGGAMMTEFVAEVPGTFLLVDHALPRAVDKGALGQLVVTGPEHPEIIRAIK